MLALKAQERRTLRKEQVEAAAKRLQMSKQMHEGIKEPSITLTVALSPLYTRTPLFLKSDTNTMQMHDEAAARKVIQAKC